MQDQKFNLVYISNFESLKSAYWLRFYVWEKAIFSFSEKMFSKVFGVVLARKSVIWFINETQYANNLHRI